MSNSTMRSIVLVAAMLGLPGYTLLAQNGLTKTQQDSARRADKEARDAVKRDAKQAEQVRKDAEDAPPTAIKVAPLPRNLRPTLSVLDFDYQTVVKQGNYDASSMAAIAAALRGTDPNALAHEDNKSIGAGLASLVKAQLFKGASFRIMERQKLGSALAEQDLASGNRADPRASQVARMRKVQAAQYVLTGSITKFGSDDKSIGGGGLLKGVLGGIGVSKKKTIVEVTAQILDASTGEVILSLAGHGVSHKGGGLVLGAATGGAGAIGGSANTNIKESAIGEAMQLAAEDLAAKVVNARGELLQGGEPEPGVAAPAENDRTVAPETVASEKSPVEERLMKVDELFRKKLITKIEHDKKRSEILKEM